MYAIVIDLGEIDRFFADPGSYLMWKIIILAIPVVWVFVWGVLQLWKDNRQGKFSSRIQRVTLAIDVPRESEQTAKAVENIFSVIKGTKSVVTFKEEWLYGKFLVSTSFEIVCIDGYIQFYVNCSAFYRDLIEAAIYSQYPDAEITEVEDYTKNLPDEFPNETHEVFGGEVILSKPSYFPIRTYLDFEHSITKDQVHKDPLIALFEFMGKLKKGEQFWVHFIVHPGDTDGPVKKGEEFILKTHGRDLPTGKTITEKLLGPAAWIPKETGRQLASILDSSEAAPEKRTGFFVPTASEKNQLEGVANKISQTTYNVKIRWGYVARHEVYNKGGRNSLWKGYVNLFSHIDRNKFKYDPSTMPRDDYFWLIWEYRSKQRGLMAALKHRSWARGSSPMLLSLEELATLWHFPTVDVKAPSIKKTEYKLGGGPTTLPEAGVGESDELPDSPLIEVDAQGRPITYGGGAGGGGDVGDGGLGDILPDEAPMELGEEEVVPEPELDEPDQPFVPPNLPV